MRDEITEVRLTAVYFPQNKLPTFESLVPKISRSIPATIFFICVSAKVKGCL